MEEWHDFLTSEELNWKEKYKKLQELRAKEGWVD